MPLTLGQALRDGRIREFIAQAEAERGGPVDRAQFEVMAARLAALQGLAARLGARRPAADHASHSHSGGNSRGT